MERKRRSRRRLLFQAALGAGIIFLSAFVVAVYFQHPFPGVSIVKTHVPQRVAYDSPGLQNTSYPYNQAPNFTISYSVSSNYAELASNVPVALAGTLTIHQNASVSVKFIALHYEGAVGTSNTNDTNLWFFPTNATETVTGKPVSIEFPIANTYALTTVIGYKNGINQTIPNTVNPIPVQPYSDIFSVNVGNNAQAFGLAIFFDALASLSLYVFRKEKTELSPYEEKSLAILESMDEKLGKIDERFDKVDYQLTAIREIREPHDEITKPIPAAKNPIPVQEIKKLNEGPEKYSKPNPEKTQ